MAALLKPDMKSLSMASKVFEAMWEDYKAKHPNRSRSDMMDEKDIVKMMAEKEAELSAPPSKKGA